MLHILKAWQEEDGPSEYFVVSAASHEQAVSYLQDCVPEGVCIEIASLDEAYRGVALLNSVENHQLEYPA